MTNLIRVMSKARKFRGSVQAAAETEYRVECKGVLAGGYNSITVFRDQRDGTVKQGTTFVVGDTAEYDSYNLSYCGKIVKITDKCVSIVKYPGTQMSATHRLNVHEFCWRNFEFNAVETERKNHNEMQYL